MGFQVVVMVGALYGEDRHKSQECEGRERKKIFSEKLHVPTTPWWGIIKRSDRQSQSALKIIGRDQITDEDLNTDVELF